MNAYCNFIKMWKKLNVSGLRFYSVNNIKKICIVGSGPAGFYTAQHILKSKEALIDIYEKLPIPFGLIRYGVAPDHQEIKSSINLFTKTLMGGRCNFFGNVKVGDDVKVSELHSAYDAVILAYGASEDKMLEIPGEFLDNVLSARQFVGWYNGLPDHVTQTINLNTDTATVIGHGNVALDVARILLKDINELKTTDIAEHAFEVLKKSKIKRVVLVGRRGPLQVAFTIKEFRELTNLSGCEVRMNPEDFNGISTLIPDLPRARRRLTELMVETLNEAQNNNNSSKSLELKFYRSPKGIIPDFDGAAMRVRLGINKIEGNLEAATVVDCEGEETFDSGLVVRSVGYQSKPIDSAVPFDTSTNVIPNILGKVVDKDGLYCSGWVKTGPFGVLLSTMHGSYETGETILDDIENGNLPTKGSAGSKAILDLLRSRGITFTTFEDWLKIDRVEQERGKSLGKPREKICRLNEMLNAAGLL